MYINKPRIRASIAGNLVVLALFVLVMVVW